MASLGRAQVSVTSLEPGPRSRCCLLSGGLARFPHSSWHRQDIRPLGSDERDKEKEQAERKGKAGEAEGLF